MGMLLAVLALLCLHAHAVPTFFPIDFSDVPADPPPGKDLTANCLCDLHPFICDRDCCCDPACPQEVTDMTRRAEMCRPEGPPPEQLDFCVPDGYVAKVNLPTGSDFFTIRKNAADDNFFGQLLCIVQSSNPRLEDEYPDPPAGDVNSNPSDVPCPQRPQSTPSIPSTYEVQTPIFISRNGVRRRLTLPVALLSTECLDTPAGFLTNIPKRTENVFQSCARSFSSASALQSLCDGGALSISRYRDFQYAPTPTASANQAPDVLDVLVLDGNNITRVDPASVDSSFAGGMCRNALHSINMTVFYTLQRPDFVEATITRIAVALTVADVDASEGLQRQFVRLNFAPQDASSEILQPYSGNPGYLRGLPLLGGVLAEDPAPDSDKTAVRRFVRGITAPQGREVDGVCSPEAEGASLRFGANSSTNCAIELTRPELEAFCLNGPPERFLEQAQREVFAALTSGEARVGIWGNSDPDQLNEWIRVRVSNFPFNRLSYDSNTASCSNVVIGWDAQVLTGVTGLASNLQRKVLYVHLCFKTATWTFPDTKPDNDPNRFYLVSTSTFIEKDQDADLITGRRKPSPPLRTPVPEDLFFPFVTSSARREAPSVRSAAALCIAAIWLLLCAAL